MWILMVTLWFRGCFKVTESIKFRQWHSDWVFTCVREAANKILLTRAETGCCLHIIKFEL